MDVAYRGLAGTWRHAPGTNDRLRLQLKYGPDSQTDSGGIVLNEPIGALAHLQLGRAYAMQGDTAKARAAYQDFLTLWKDADPDIPILKQAKA